MFDPVECLMLLLLTLILAGVWENARRLERLKWLADLKQPDAEDSPS